MGFVSVRKASVRPAGASNVYGTYAAGAVGFSLPAFRVSPIMPTTVTIGETFGAVGAVAGGFSRTSRRIRRPIGLVPDGQSLAAVSLIKAIGSACAISAVSNALPARSGMP